MAVEIHVNRFGLTILLPVLLSGYISIGSGQSGYETTTARVCVQPGVFNDNVTVDGNVLGGLWYPYRQNLQGVAAMATNQQLNYSIIGKTLDPASGADTVALTVTTSYYNGSDATNCTNNYFIGTQAATGKRLGFTFYPDKTLPDNYNTVVFNGSLIKLNYNCAQVNLNGQCTAPTFVVIIRQNPLDMTAQDKTNIDNIINTALARFCVTADQIPLALHTREKPYCPNPTSPSCISNLVTAYAQSTVPLTPPPTMPPPAYQ